MMAKKRKRRRVKQSEGLLATLRDPNKIRVAYIIAGLALVFGGSLAFGGVDCDNARQNNPFGGGEDPPAIAMIQDQKIFWHEWIQQYETNRRNQDQGGAVLRPAEWEASVQYSTLRQMIDMAYFDIKAEEAGIVIPDESVEETVEMWRSRLLPQETVDTERSILERIGDAFQSVKSDKAFEQALRATDPNMTSTRLRENIRQYLTAEEYVRQLTAEKDTDIMRELTGRANEIITEINTNSLESDLDSAFAAAAMTHSEHMVTKPQGGEMDMVKHNTPELPSAVRARAFELPLGEISGPIQSQEPGPDNTSFKGVWLITVSSRKEAIDGDPDWELASETLRAELLEAKRLAIEAGEIPMPEDENITVSEDEIKTAYEEANIRVIYLQAEDPMERVTTAVRDDQASMNVTIYSPTIRAMHHVFNQNWDLAGADYAEALKDLKDRLDKGDISQVEMDLQEARIRYLIANLWATRALMSESQWMQDIWMTFQANPDAFGGAFPEPPAWIKSEQQGYFALSVKNLDRAIDLQESGIEIDIPDPFYRWQRAQIDVARSQLTERLIDDLDAAHTFANDDSDLEQRILSVIGQAISLDNAALAEAEDVRPETWIDPVFPEDEMGLVLDQIDQPFIDMIPLVEVEEGEASASVPAGGADLSDDIVLDVEPVTDPEIDLEPVDVSAVEPEDEIVPDEPEAVEETEPVDEVEVTEESADGDYKHPEWLPLIPVMDPNGPLTQDLRDQLEALQTVVQANVDRINAARQSAEAAEQARMQQQIENLQINTPVEEEEGENLLDEE